MKLLFKRLPAITHTQIFQPLKRTLLTLLFTVPQVPIQYPLLGSISSGGKALAQAQTSCPAGTSPATLEWNPTNNLQDFLSQNLSAGGVSTTFRFSESSPGVIDAGETLIDPGIYGGVTGPNLRFNIGGNSQPGQQTNPAPVGSSATLTITFAQPVTLASPLTFLDIDRNGAVDPVGRIFQDRVTIRALNGNTPVGVTGTALSTNTRVTNQGNSVLAEGINENARTDQSAGNIQVRTSERITQIQILYEPGTEFGAPGQDETIGLARLNICAPLPGGTLGDTVYNDTNRNNTQDSGETGISDVTVNLAGAGPDGQFGTPDDITRTATTDSNGGYTFFGLPAGSYQVSVNNPPGFTPTQTQPQAIPLAAGQNIDTVDFGFLGGAVGAGNTGLRLVKRITNVFRNGQLVNIADISGFVDDPNDNNDNILQQAGRPPFGVYQIGQTASLQSGDEVEYTIYYLAEGDQDLQNVSFCDLIPPETSYSSGEISVNRAGETSLLTNAEDSDQGTFYTPLRELPPEANPNRCPVGQTNTKGAVIVNLGTITITPDTNFGFLRFRVRID